MDSDSCVQSFIHFFLSLGYLGYLILNRSPISDCPLITVDCLQMITYIYICIYIDVGRKIEQAPIIFIDYWLWSKIDYHFV